MRFSIAVLFGLATVSSVAAVPLNAVQQFTAKYHWIPSITTMRGSQADENSQNASISFKVWDKDPQTNARTTCSATWEIGSHQWPSDYVHCKDINFMFYLDWKSVSYFDIELKHSFPDSQVGSWVTTFSHGHMDLGNLTCATPEAGGKECTKTEGDTLKLDIYAAIA